MEEIQYRAVSETPFKWCFAGRPMVVRFYMFTGYNSNINNNNDYVNLNEYTAQDAEIIS